jgi:UrcA family protein
MISRLGLTALALTGAVAAQPAHALDYRWLSGGREQVVMTRVSHADLDLSKPGHVRELRRRVHRAAVQLCSDEDPPLAINLETKRCVRAAARAAMPQIANAVRAGPLRLAERSDR